LTNQINAKMDFKHLLDFLTRLSKNNNKEWFDANKKEYETLRNEWIGFVGESIQAFGAFDSAILELEPKKCIFRINRDVRFSKNKDPYKNNFGMSLSSGGKASDFCGYYLHIQPGECFVAGGAYQPMPDKLAAIRQEIDYNYNLFNKIVSAKSFKSQFGNLSGDKLSRPPKGYDADNPAVEFLKHKGFIAYRKIDDKALLNKRFMTDLIESGRAMKPLIDFLNQAISN
jgi:uncharacterized protein (TIGR02453 family)